MEKICGVYMIQSKIKPERVYVGSSHDILRRFNHHEDDINRGEHHSVKLQRHADKYGNNDLVFEIIESFDFINKKHLLATIVQLCKSLGRKISMISVMRSQTTRILGLLPQTENQILALIPRTRESG